MAFELEGDVEEDEFEQKMRTENSLLDVGKGEIKLDDLRDRLTKISRSLGAEVVGLSLFISETFISYLFVVPKADNGEMSGHLGFGGGVKEFGDLAVHLVPIQGAEKASSGLRRRLGELLDGRNQFDFSNNDWANAVFWPDDFILTFAALLDDIQAILPKPIGHILLR